MKGLFHFVLATGLLLLAQAANGRAPGPYDGEWTGAATSTGGRCKPATVTLTVEGTAVLGDARFEVDAPHISGTVLEDGTVGATIGFQHLTGKFTRDEFEGSFRSFDCVWNMLLKRRN